MRIRNLHNRIAGILLGLSLLVAVGIVFSTTANAQDRDRDQNRRDRNWDRYGNYGGSAELRQTALNAGYNEGIRAGNDDRQNRRQSNYRSSNAYRKATQDYNSRLGDRELYRRYFREAFESGYNANGYGQISRVGDDRYRNPDRNNTGNQTRRGRNWDGYGNYGGSFQLRQTALNAGYNEGNKNGRNDRRRGRYSDFQNSSAYQKATQDYSSRLGDRELYRRYYREGFANGYSDGSNGY
jgi:hypothetical protein